MSDKSLEEASAQPPLGCLLRMFWMAGGNVGLVYSAVVIANSERIGVPDLVYASLVAALLVARYIDIAKLHGLTANAAPASAADFRRYAFILVGVTLVGWALARVVSSHG